MHFLTACGWTKRLVHVIGNEFVCNKFELTLQSPITERGLGEIVCASAIDDSSLFVAGSDGAHWYVDTFI